jgi:methionine-rich copper-binding protein CopC
MAAAVMVLMLAGLGLQKAEAHARLVRSNPADKAQLEKAPAQIELRFNELLDDNFNSVKVFPAAQLRLKQRTEFAAGKPKVDAQDRTRLFVEVKPLPPGDFVVEWRVLSRDGHSASGRFSFRVLASK